MTMRANNSNDIRAKIQRAFTEASKKTGVPVKLLKMVAAIESDNRADVESPTGAEGIMQIMPKTKEDIIKRLAPKGAFPTDALGWDKGNVGQNVLLGAYYLKDILGMKGIDNDWERAMAAYNIGPGNRWIKKPNWKEDKRYSAARMGSENYSVKTYIDRANKIVGDRGWSDVPMSSVIGGGGSGVRPSPSAPKPEPYLQDGKAIFQTTPYGGAPTPQPRGTAPTHEVGPINIPTGVPMPKTKEDISGGDRLRELRDQMAKQRRGEQEESWQRPALEEGDVGYEQARMGQEIQEYWRNYKPQSGINPATGQPSPMLSATERVKLFHPETREQELKRQSEKMLRTMQGIPGYPRKAGETVDYPIKEMDEFGATLPQGGEDAYNKQLTGPTTSEESILALPTKVGPNAMGSLRPSEVLSQGEALKAMPTKVGPNAMGLIDRSKAPPDARSVGTERLQAYPDLRTSKDPQGKGSYTRQEIQEGRGPNPLPNLYWGDDGPQPQSEFADMITGRFGKNIDPQGQAQPDPAAASASQPVDPLVKVAAKLGISLLPRGGGNEKKHVDFSSVTGSDKPEEQSWLRKAWEAGEKYLEPVAEYGKYLPIPYVQQGLTAVDALYDAEDAVTAANRGDYLGAAMEGAGAYGGAKEYQALQQGGGPNPLSGYNLLGDQAESSDLMKGIQKTAIKIGTDVAGKAISGGYGGGSGGRGSSSPYMDQADSAANRYRQQAQRANQDYQRLTGGRLSSQGVQGPTREGIIGRQAANLTSATQQNVTDLYNQAAYREQAAEMMRDQEDKRNWMGLLNNLSQIYAISEMDLGDDTATTTEDSDPFGLDEMKNLVLGRLTNG